MSKVEEAVGLSIIDETSLEYGIALYSQSLNIVAAENLLQLFLQLYGVSNSSINSDGQPQVLSQAQSQLSAIYVSLSRAYALVGRHDDCEKYEELARTTIKSAKSNILLDAMKATAAKDKGDVMDKKQGGNGNNSTSALFQQHRYAELIRDCDLINQYNSSLRETGGSSFGEGYSRARMELAVSCLSKVLLLNEMTPSANNTVPGRNIHDFSSNEAVGSKRKDKHDDSQHSTKDWCHDLKACMVKNVLQKFGLDQLCTLLACEGDEDATRNVKAKAMNAIMRNTSTIPKRDDCNELGGTTSGHCIRFDRVFKLCSHAGGGTQVRHTDDFLDDDVVVKMEIGSGSGEWVVQQALKENENQNQASEAEKKKVLWVSLEQVYLRVSHVTTSLYCDITYFTDIPMDSHLLLRYEVSNDNLLMFVMVFVARGSSVPDIPTQCHAHIDRAS